MPQTTRPTTPKAAMKPKEDPVARAIVYALVSPNESDSNMEPANVVDAIVKGARIQASATLKLADAIDRLAEALTKR